MRALIPLLATGLALAACGGSSHSSSSNSPAASSPSPTSTVATTTSPTTTAPASGSTSPTTTSASGPAGPRQCVAAQLQLSFLGGQGATGHGELGFALRNTSNQTCVAFGYPGIQFLDRAGGPLPTKPIHTPSDFFGTVSTHAFALTPGSDASFRLGVTHGATSTAGCTTAYGLQVIPPNDTSTLRTQIPNGAYQCQTATVTPLQRGTTAFS